MVIKRGFLVFLLSIVLILPLLSAAVIISTQPAASYNLGDVATTKVTFKPVQAVSGNFQMDLVCGATPLNFYKSGMQVAAGTERVIESSLVLIKDVIENNRGICTIKAYFGTDSATTKEFIISDQIKVNTTLEKAEFLPGETITIKGTALKENAKPSNGYLEVALVADNSTFATQKATISNGAFATSIIIPEDARAGSFFLRVLAYEEDISGQTTNSGNLETGILVKQVPKTLEIVFDHTSNGTEIEFLPGEDLRVKAVLRDQAGLEMSSSVFITIKNSKNKIAQQTEVSTGEFVDFPLAYNEPPSVWKIIALSNKITTESSFSILEKESVDIKVENNTILVTNTGNVPYNKTIAVNVGSKGLEIPVYLDVNENKRWLVSAPDGQYDLSIFSEGDTIRTTAILTGDAIDIRRASEGLTSLMRFPSVWIFILLVLGVMTFIVFRRGYQKTFIGYITDGLGRNNRIATLSSSGSFGIAPKSKAELMVSIKGEKQEVSMITFKIKNLPWIKNIKEGTSALEVIKKITSHAESNKAATYDSGESIFFMFAPSRTKTFRNEITAVKIAKEIKEMLDRHNKMFKQKIEYGISLNLGEIIAKQDLESFKFMGIGNFLSASKKIASVAENEIFMGEKMADTVKTLVKTEKHERSGMKVYSVKEIKDMEKHDKFIKGFMKRQEK